MDKKRGYGIAVSMGVIAILLSSLLMSSPSYAAEGSLPTGNTGLKGTPTPIPGVISTGDYIRIGVNPGGTFGVGNGTDGFGTGFQYPIGLQYESLAIWWWGDGYVFAYKTYNDETGQYDIDNIAYWQPGYGWPPPAACNIVPVAFRRVNEDKNFAHYLAQVSTADGILVINFRFLFAKHMKYVTLYTEIYVRETIKDLLYKRFVDWDIHWDTYNEWSTDSHSAYASYYNQSLDMEYVFTVAGDTVTNWNKYTPYAEAYGWDDYTVRPPGTTFQSHHKPMFFDGAAMITFDLGNGNPRKAGSVLQTTLYYQAGENPFSYPG